MKGEKAEEGRVRDLLRGQRINHDFRPKQQPILTNVASFRPDAFVTSPSTASSTMWSQMMGQTLAHALVGTCPRTSFKQN